MIQQSTLDFLHGLAQNNIKSWFDANKKSYEHARKDVLNLTDDLIKEFSKKDKNIAAANLESKACISRINRDVRFSKDKSPYKNNFFALISQGGKKSNYACYYLEIRPGGSFVGAGSYMPMPEDLNKIRQEIDYNFKEWEQILQDTTLKDLYPNGIEAPEKLNRPPKGYEVGNPALEYLKMKGFYVWKPLSDKELISNDALNIIMKNWLACQDLVAFLNRAIVG
ncbi:MAG: DUF2461 domain-containing protein [Leadbetterella sp.]